MKPWEVVSDVLSLLASKAEAGITTKELDEIGEKRIRELRAIPYNKGYHPKWAKEPFPASICTSVNDTVCHGLPSDYVLKDGDIINFDVGIKINGQCGDASLTVGVGKLDNRQERLLYYAKKTLYEGISKIKSGVHISEISKAIDTYASLRGFVTNMNYGGHGIGQEMHEDPLIPNFAFTRGDDPVLKTNQIICIEPQLSYKDRLGYVSDDGWSVKTRDGRNSAFFEHMIRVKKDGYKILTTHICEN